jgi:hypothetical protein
MKISSTISTGRKFRKRMIKVFPALEMAQWSSTELDHLYHLLGSSDISMPRFKVNQEPVHSNQNIYCHR